MSFTSPLILTLLLPWAILAYWLIRGRRAEVGVPFLELWRGPAVGAPRHRAVRWPAAHLLAGLLAILLAILAAAGPGWRGGGNGAVVPVLLVDRGYTMSAGLRYRTLGHAVVRELRREGVTRADLWSVPATIGGPNSLSGLDFLLTELEPTAADTAAALRYAVARAPVDRPVVVVTDQDVVGADDANGRVIVVQPDTPVQNVGIAGFAVRAGQAMVRVRNDSFTTGAELEIRSDGNVVERRSIELPPVGEERNYFVDLPLAGAVVEAGLLVQDDMSADDRAWLLRQRTWPEVEVRVPGTWALQRMAEVYRTNRPAGEGSARVIVTASSPSAARPATATVYLRPARPDAPPPAGEPVVVVHPLTKDIDWRDLLRDAPISLEAPPVGFAPLLSVGGRTLLAMREDPVPQVWIGFDVGEGATRPDYVVFWTNVFDWAGRAATDELRADPVGRLPGGWRPIPMQDNQSAEPGLWPGVYENRAGQRRAVNAPARPIPAPGTPPDWREMRSQLDRWATGRPLDRVLLLGALIFGLISACCWPRLNLTAFSAERTV